MAYPPEFKDKCFLDWFQKGQPGYMSYHHVALTDELSGKKPALQVIRTWIVEEWRPRAEILNEQIKDELEGRLVKEKVEMLKRHSEIGQELTDKAMAYLRENEFTTSANALRAVVEGIRIEHESRGLPEALDKMSKVTDERLIDQVKGILEKSSVTIEPNE